MVIFRISLFQGFSQRKVAWHVYFSRFELGFSFSGFWDDFCGYDVIKVITKLQNNAIFQDYQISLLLYKLRVFIKLNFTVTRDLY